MRTGDRPAPANAAAIQMLITAAAAAANTPNVTHVAARTRTSTTRLATRSIGGRQCFHSATSAERSGAGSSTGKAGVVLRYAAQSAPNRRSSRSSSNPGREPVAGRGARRGVHRASREGPGG